MHFLRRNGKVNAENILYELLIRHDHFFQWNSLPARSGLIRLIAPPPHVYRYGTAASEVSLNASSPKSSWVYANEIMLLLSMLAQATIQPAR